MNEDNLTDDSDDCLLPDLNFPCLPTQTPKKSCCKSMDDRLSLAMSLADDHKNKDEYEKISIIELEDTTSNSSVNADEELTPESPKDIVDVEIEVKFFWAKDCLEYFNLQDVTLQNCGYNLCSTENTTFENLIVSTESVALENELSSMLSVFGSFRNFKKNCKNIKPFTYYLLKMMSIHEEEATVLMCEDILKNIIIGHFDVKISVSKILIILFNYGVDIQSWAIFKSLPKLKLKSSNLRKGISRIPSNWLYNLESLLNIIEELILTSSFTNKDLLKLMPYFLWMGLDSSIQNEYTVISKIRKCLSTAIEVTSEETWPHAFKSIFNFVMSVEQSTINHKWEVIYHLVKSFSPLSKRGLLLQKIISITSLRKLLSLSIKEHISFLDEDYTLSDLELILKSICVTEANNIQIAIKFLDICISHLKLSSKEHHVALCGFLKMCENKIESRNDTALNEQAHLVRIHSRIMLMSPDNPSVLDRQIKNIKTEPDTQHSESSSDVSVEGTKYSYTSSQKIDISESIPVNLKQDTFPVVESPKIKLEPLDDAELHQKTIPVVSSPDKKSKKTDMCLDSISDINNEESNTSLNLFPLDKHKEFDFKKLKKIPVVKLSRIEISDFNDKYNMILKDKCKSGSGVDCHNEISISRESNDFRSDGKKACTVKGNDLKQTNNKLPVVKFKKNKKHDNLLLYDREDKSASSLDNVNEIENCDSFTIKDNSVAPNVNHMKSNDLKQTNNKLPVVKFKENKKHDNLLLYDSEDKSASSLDNINEIENLDSFTIKDNSVAPNVNHMKYDKNIVIPDKSTAQKITLEESHKIIKNSNSDSSYSSNSSSKYLNQTGNILSENPDITMKNIDVSKHVENVNCETSVAKCSNTNFSKKNPIISSEKQKSSEESININQSKKIYKSSKEENKKEIICNKIPKGDIFRIVDYKGAKALVKSSSNSYNDVNITPQKLNTSHFVENNHNNKSIISFADKGSSNPPDILNYTYKSNAADSKSDIDSTANKCLPNSTTFQNPERKNESYFKTSKVSVSCSITEKVTDCNDARISMPREQLTEINPNSSLISNTQSNLVISSDIAISPAFPTSDIHVTVITETPNQVLSNSICQNDSIQTGNVFTKSIVNDTNLHSNEDQTNNDLEQSASDIFIVKLKSNSPTVDEIIVLDEDENEEDEEIQIINETLHKLPMKRAINSKRKHLSAKRAKLLECQPSGSSHLLLTKQKSSALPILESYDKKKTFSQNIPSLFNFCITSPPNESSVSNNNKKESSHKKNKSKKSTNSTKSDKELICNTDSDDCQIIPGPNEIITIDD